MLYENKVELFTRPGNSVVALSGSASGWAYGCTAASGEIASEERPLEDGDGVSN
jgi:hypothetical protein